MTRTPPSRDPGTYPPRYPAPRRVPPGTVEPQLPSPYPPGREPVPPRRPQRRSPVVAPLLAFVGLILVAGISLWAMNFLDATIGDAAANEPSDQTAFVDDAVATEAPGDPQEPAALLPEATDTPIVEPPSDERADVQGSILFTRSGDIWSASGTQLRRLTNSTSTKSDAYPAWSPDGKHVYFIRTTRKTTSNSRPGGKYTLYQTDLMRMDGDGGGRKKVADALIRDSRGLWFSHIVQPSVGPGGDIAVVSDGPDGSAEEVTLHLVNPRNGQLRKVATPTDPRLGHNDPAFSPDGRKIAFTYNGSNGASGQPKIGIFTCRSKGNCAQGKVKYLKPGFANPSWSPDGRLLAAEATDGTGRDIVVLTARRGDVRVELTTDGNSFGPVFSPAGDQIAYLHRDGLAIDLRVMTLEFDDRGLITKVDDRPITSDGGIDGISTPSWFIPPQELDPVAAAGTADGDAPDGPDDGATEASAPVEDETGGGESASGDSGEPPPPPPGA